MSKSDLEKRTVMSPDGDGITFRPTDAILIPKSTLRKPTHSALAGKLTTPRSI